MASPKSTLPNDEKETQDSHYNPGEHSYREGMGAGYSSAGADQAEAFANDPANHDSADTIREKEEDATTADSNWKSTYGGNITPGGKKLTSLNVRAILKKRGPLGLIALLGLGGGLVGTLLFSPGLILVQMKESLVDRFNTQLSSMDSRQNSIINKKINGSTSGVCGTKITILCKYSTMSDKQAARLKSAGITVEGEPKFGNRIKPTSFTFNNEAPMSAKEFTSRMSTDVELRNAMKKAYNPKFAGFADKIWGKVAAKLGITKQRALVDGDKEAKAKALEENVKNGKKFDISGDNITCKGDVCQNDKTGEPLTAEQKAARSAAIQASEDLVNETEGVATNAIGKTVGSGVDAVGSFLKVTGGADAACQVYTAVRGLGYAAKTVRAVQLARYAMVFINTADQIKAGTAKPEDVAYLGGILTDVAVDVKTGEKRKAAMDSAGMKYSLYGDTSGFKQKGSGSYVSQFMAGGGLTGDLIALTTYIDDQLKGNAKNTCQVLSNGWVQLGSAAAGIGLMLIPGVNIAVGAADIAKAGLSITASIALAILPDLLKDIVAGNVTKKIIGEDSGNAIASGFGKITSDVAQRGGNPAMSYSDAVAYNNLQTETIARYAADESSGLSPLDPTNKNTFIGSIVNKMLPYATSNKAFTNPLFAFGSLTSLSFSSVLPSASAISAADQQAAYQTCTDPDYKELGIAADPFCNPVFGIPPQYLSRDPVDVATALAGQYDETTGEPISGSNYDTYVKSCINAEEPLGSVSNDDAKCKVNPDNANYYLFFVDQRVDTGLDGYDSTVATSSETSTADTTIDQAHIYDPSVGIACAAGTTDAGVAQGYHNGIEVDIRICSIPNTVDMSAGKNNEPIRVNSRISGATLSITKALAASPANGGKPVLRISDSFRTMANQQEALAIYGLGRAAKPGYSNHQMGLAIDFQLGSNTGVTRPGDPVYDWLVSNARTYGFAKLITESWHWQAQAAQGSLQS